MVGELPGLRERHCTREGKSQARKPRKTGNTVAASHGHANIQPQPGTVGSLHVTVSWEGNGTNPSVTHSSCLTPAFIAERGIPAGLGRLCGSVPWLWPLPTSGATRSASSLDKQRKKQRSPWLCASTALQQLKTWVR